MLLLKQQLVEPNLFIHFFLIIFIVKIVFYFFLIIHKYIKNLVYGPEQVTVYVLPPKTYATPSNSTNDKGKNRKKDKIDSEESKKDKVIVYTFYVCSIILIYWLATYDLPPKWWK